MVRHFLIGLGLLSLMAGFPALADEPRVFPEPHRASGVFCSELPQARAFLEVFTGDNRVEAINTANNGTPIKDGCGTADIIVVQSETYDTMKTKTGTWLLVQVLVVGQVEGEIVRMLNTPIVQYTAIRIEDPVPEISL